MATDDPIRASDADRELVVDTLREAFEDGRLTLDEFDERMTDAYASKNWGDLRKLTVDLPSQPLLGADIPVHDLAPSAGLVPGLTAAEDPDELPQTPPFPARRRPVAVLIPIAVWALLVVHASVAPGAVFLLIAVFALISIMSSIRRR